MRTRWVSLLAFLIGCDSLWASSLIPNPDRCDVSPSVCPTGQVCDTSTGRCVAVPSPDSTSNRCGTPWRTTSGAFSFQAKPLLVSMGTDGDLVGVALADVDGNQVPDLAAVSASMKLWSYLGAGDGQFTAHATSTLTGTAGMLRLADA